MDNRKKEKLGKYRICVAKKFYAHKIKHLKNAKLKAAFMKKFIWPEGSTINIGFMNQPSKDIERRTAEQIKLDSQNLKLDPLQKEVDKMPIIEAIKRIVDERLAPIVNLNFVYVDDINSADIRVDFDETDGCWSYIGIDCKNPKYKGESTINFAWFDVATTIHEFCHALGMIHEHQNPKNNLIDWNLDAVYMWAQKTQGWDKDTTNLNIIEPAQMQEINGSEYDPYSIMLYFYPPELTKDNKGTNENLRISAQDVIFLNKTYPNSQETPAEFYRNVYNEDINDVLKKEGKALLTNDKKSSIPPFLYISVSIIILVIIILIFFLYNK